MPLLKVIEVMTESEKSWEDAAQSAVTKASETLHNIRSINIENLQATVENGKLVRFRINAKIAFVVD
jgi:flavin-binding protein dodecin